ncbi:ketopantoate reductase family protein [Lentzea jiangxiensis]|uniref:2-dehydropantoate 2-reductase n=1 Tax=Lentzea jiangxiensis TaxID=641025 RepID=A0A1H0WCL7_9PSEU|nr:2-dehydropantoate 2-reductase N-terminal domain-containing protein [Lentzea jiangxiensis]SDP88195.1 2-dehydropantoate 2-reductase [Lentzea jiangxiensis]
MKILMFGRGAIATFYGWALHEAGHDVEFYVRPGRAAAYGNSVELDLLDTRRSLRGRRVVRQWPVRLREELPADHDFDLIVLSLPHHRLAEAAAFLAPRVGNATVLVFGNLWSDPPTAVSPLPLDRVAWGFPQAGGGFGEDGVLRGALLPTVFFGTLGTPPTPREQAVRQLFGRAGFRLLERPDFTSWLRIHFVFNAALHSQGLKHGSLAGLLGARDALREALLVGRELLPLLEASGVDLRSHRGGVLPFRLPTWLVAPLLSWVITHFPAARVNFEAQSDPTAAEPREICRDTLAEARRWGVPTPRLEAAEPHFAVR